MKIKIILLMLGILSMFPSSFLHAQDYSQDYGVIGASGAVSVTTDYNIVDFVTELGISQGAQASTDYSVLPVIGLEDETSSVSDWMLY